MEKRENEVEEVRKIHSEMRFEPNVPAKPRSSSTMPRENLNE